MKKVLVLLIAVAMLVTIPATAFAASTIWNDNIPVASMAVGQFNTFAVKADGSLWGMGLNSGGQLGIGSTAGKSSMAKIMDGVKSISSGGAHTLILKRDNSLWAVGANSLGQLGDGTTEDRLSPVKIMDDVKTAQAGYSHSAAVKNDGTLWAWGFNEKTQLTGAIATTALAPAQLMDGVSDVAAGTYYTFVVKQDGTVWKLAAATEQIAGNATQLSDGKEHLAFVDNVASSWAWGLNLSGQLGDGTTEDKLTVVKVLDDVKKVAAGNSHTLFLKNDNTLWACGDNTYGQLGNGTTTSSATPIHVMDSISDVFSRGFHNSAIKIDGSVVVWGKNTDSQLGTGEAQILSPKTVFSFSSNPSFWAVGEVNSAIELGIVTSKSTLDYQGSITREEFAELVVILYETLAGSAVESQGNPFTDTANADVIKAYSAGIVLGTSESTFAPNDLITRQEIATMFVRALTKLFPDKAIDKQPLAFADNDQIAEWAVDGIQYSVAAGLMKGKLDNLVDPLGNCTREEALLINLRSFNNFR